MRPARSGALGGWKRRWIVDASVVLAIAVASFAALKCERHDYVFALQFSPEYREILPQTAWAALRVWLFWGFATLVLARLLLRVEPALGLLDAMIGGMIGVWIFAYLAANLLGPIGLFREWLVGGFLVLGVWVWRVPLAADHPPPPGLKLALLAFALLAPGLLILQLGTIVPPYMDILATPASAQRILTFGRYLPFDNDPYGYWDAASQCPGTELLYAFLGLGSGTSLAVLAESAAILPMAALFIVATYRLGRSIGGDVMGGMSALLLFATVFLRVLPYMHGREVTFPLVAVGLAFLLDPRRDRIRLALGALALGTAIAAHAIIGAFGMVTAALSVLFWLLAGDVAGAFGGVALLAGASLVAVPTLAIGLRMPLAYPALPAAQLLGVGVIVLAARSMHGRPLRDRGLARWLGWALALVAIYVLVEHPAKLGVLNDHWNRFPLLSIGAIGGLLIMLWLDVRRSARVQLAPVVLAFLFGVALDYVSREWWTTFTEPKVQTAIEDFYHKVDYWNPYVLIFPTACLFAWLYRSVSPRLAVFGLVALLFYPWKDVSQHPDPNYHQHSIAEAYAFELQLAKGGYWGATGHRRWAQSAAELELVDVLRAEIAAGRITLATHIVHLAPDILLYQDNVLFSVYTGINDDGYLANYEFDRSIAGGRLHPIAQLDAALAKRPPYIVLHESTSNGRKLYDVMPRLPSEVLQDYEEIFNRDGVRLLRDRALAPQARESTSRAEME
ncbi:MAG: hypothetical protein HY271_19230 [Deltaproteobacteria bacterium]|nr:hypothetical protein [Deltaproteobacteria bacterium]